MTIALSRPGENEEGDLCTIWRTVKFTRDEMAQFVWMETAGDLRGANV